MIKINTKELTEEERKFVKKVGFNVRLNKKINKEKLPRHIAFIMDGNGRWAAKRGLPRAAGHKFGYEKMLMVVKRCADYDIEVCSLYAFSTENWNRPQDELDEIFRLIRENMHRDTEEFLKWNIRVVTMGDVTKFPRDLQDKLAEVMEKTKNNTGCTLNLCINYGGRADIVRAIKKIKDNSKVTEQSFSELLYGADLPSPDLIVRTSGEQRISKFMLWQLSYSEFLFIRPHWPSMTPKLVDKCLIEYQKRNRRFGRV